MSKIGDEFIRRLVEHGGYVALESLLISNIQYQADQRDLKQVELEQAIGYRRDIPFQ